MKTMKRLWSGILAAACLLELLSGCGAKKQTVIRACVCSAMETVDPAAVSDVGQESILLLLYEGLMRLSDDGRDGTELIGGVARDYDCVKNSDGTVTYRFFLRSSSRWTNGERVDADDFVYAWRRLADPATDSPHASLLSCVAGYDQARRAKDMSLLAVQAENASTFTVTLRYDDPAFLSGVCTAAATVPLRKETVDAAPVSWATEHPFVTNGTYRVSAWEKEKTISLRRNEDYYDRRRAKPDGFDFSFTGGEDALTLYQTGELDLLYTLPLDLLSTVERAAQKEANGAESYPVPYKTAQNAATYCVLYNLESDRFMEASVRQAFDCAIARETIATATVTATPADRLIPPSLSAKAESDMTGNNPLRESADANATPQDLMAKYGYAPESDPVTLNYLYVHSARNDVTANLLCKMWHDALGIEAVPEGVDAEEFARRIAAGEYEIAGMMLAAEKDDPLDILRRFDSGSADNVIRYGNNAYDVLVGAVERADSSASRGSFLHDAEALLLDDWAVSPLYFDTDAYLIAPQLQGVYTDLFGHIYLNLLHYPS